MSLAGIAGGMAWAAIPAFLRTRFNANEILVSLMLIYVAVLLLGSLVTAPLRDPEGFNFPQSRLFHDRRAAAPHRRARARTSASWWRWSPCGLAWLLLARHSSASRSRCWARRRARPASAASRTAADLVLLPGLAAACAAWPASSRRPGPVGQLVPALPAGYGFTAIIVAFLGRLHPVGILLAGLLLALTYIGGETAQICHRPAQRRPPPCSRACCCSSCSPPTCW